MNPNTLTVLTVIVVLATLVVVTFAVISPGPTMTLAAVTCAIASAALTYVAFGSRNKGSS